ncbi:MAG: GNAT family N-acetyltransferase [Rhodobacteraceae bacterium]|nr:GNAT family N-acetyltransferase [Paracoccaceae bacterium]
MTGTTVQIPTLETERLFLRAPRMDDFDMFFDFFASDRAEFVGGPQTDRLSAWRGYGHIAGQWVLRGYGSFVVTDKTTSAPIGLCGPWHPVTWPEAEIGWSVWTPDAEGKGFAFEAANAALDYVFLTIGWDTAVSYIDPGNARSIALAERLGATRDDTALPPEFDGPKSLIYRHPRRVA